MIEIILATWSGKMDSSLEPQQSGRMKIWKRKSFKIVMAIAAMTLILFCVLGYHRPLLTFGPFTY